MRRKKTKSGKKALYKAINKVLNKRIETKKKVVDAIIQNNLYDGTVEAHQPTSVLSAGTGGNEFVGDKIFLKGIAWRGYVEHTATGTSVPREAYFYYALVFSKTVLAIGTTFSTLTASQVFENPVANPNNFVIDNEKHTILK